MTHPVLPWTIEGFSEIGLGSRTPEAWLRLFVDTGGWEVLWEGPGNPQPLWPPGQARPDHEWLLGHRDSGTGRVRLMRFDAPVPAPRQGAMPWDTGGIFDLDLRVTQLRAQHRELLSAGWKAFSEPIDWSFGTVRVRESLLEGPDGVVVALVQRLEPPLEQRPGERGFSHAFNATQTVRRMAASLEFFGHLGFREYARHEAPLAGRGGEVLGLTAREAPGTDVSLAILHPDAVLDGSVELVALPGRSGDDLADQCGPARRGLNLFRFPVRGLAALAQACPPPGGRAHGPVGWNLPPYGDVRGLALETPDGAWLELIEVAP